MRILALVENLCGHLSCTPAHGLSLYIETDRHRLVLDAGPGEVLMHNAHALGVDLRQAEMLILSHGHYDHADGIPHFAALHPAAPILLRSTASGAYYSGSAELGTLHYIGMDPAVEELSQLEWVDGDLRIDEQLSLFGHVEGRRLWPQSNLRLSRREDERFLQDSFDHEQCLVIHESGKSVLLSGCAHNGILNILDRYRQLYGSAPDVVISGFHMKKTGEYTPEEIATIRQTAIELKALPSLFYTCHCTGTIAYDIMKEIMGDQLHYLHCGEEITI